MAFKPYCNQCQTWHTEREGHRSEMSERTIWHMVADLHNPKAEPFAVIRADTSIKSGCGVEGTVVSVHWDRAEAEYVARNLDGEKSH